MKFKLGLASCCVIAVSALGAASASADPSSGPPICNGTETAISGSYGNLTITGNKYVPAGDTLSVSGNLNVAPSACLDAFTTGTVTVGHNVVVSNRAILALGCEPFADGMVDPCGTTTTNDTVGRSLVANHPYTMYLTALTIGGNLYSTGGGPGATFKPYVNFPIKDSHIAGNVSITGWRGAWFGMLRSTVGLNAIFRNLVSPNPDSNEIATNTVGRNLICEHNSPPAQIGDSGGSPNTVGGRNIGCP